MFVSANRTPVQLVAIEAVASAEAINLLVNALLFSLEPDKLALAIRERAQILSDEAAHRAAVLRRADPRGAIDVVGNGYGDICHCASQYHRNTVSGPMWKLSIKAPRPGAERRKNFSVRN